MQKNVTDFSTGSVKKRIIAQAVPLTLAQAVQLLYNIVDRIYIGHLPEVGQVALTGLGITFPVIVIIAAFTQLLGTGQRLAGDRPGGFRHLQRQKAGNGCDRL